MDGEDEGAAPEALEETPLLPEERLPTLEEYHEKWERLYRQHTRTVKGNFGPNNLVPDPAPQLFQNCPWVFSEKHPNHRPDILTSTSCGVRPIPQTVESWLCVYHLNWSGTVRRAHGQRRFGGGARTPCQVFPADGPDAQYNGGWR